MDAIARVFSLVSQNDDAGVTGIKLHCAADAVGLRAGHECTAGTAEQIHHHAVGRGTVLDRIGKQRDGFHRGMFFAALGLVEVPDG